MKTTRETPAASAASATNPLGVRRVHHVELVVGNAKQAAYFYRKAFGFSQVAYRGLETGSRTEASYVLEQGAVRLVLTTPLGPDTWHNEHLRLHGDGVRDVALEVADVDHAFAEAVARGAEAVSAPRDLEGKEGAVRHAAIRAHNDTIHSFVAPQGYEGAFLPGWEAARIEARPVGLAAIDHVVSNMAVGDMDRQADFYARVFGFTRYITFDDKDISTEYSALQSVVMSDHARVVKMPINEPAPGKRKSQIEEYLDWYHGSGVQHVALLTGDAIEAVRRLRDNGVEFLTIPDSYYDTLLDRVGPIDEPLDVLRDLRLLVDRDDEGYLLQIFTKPVQDRPTLFYEIIQRKGCRGFGKGNFKALFESIELEQARRGNL